MRDPGFRGPIKIRSGLTRFTRSIPQVESSQTAMSLERSALVAHSVSLLEMNYFQVQRT